ncbi:MAG TPA: hypothetical protein VLI89_09540 [Burkholderiales bacterium]|jgi:hypothetical protein|nr:hypothetical protein [Burkholderiales bacterium]
MATKEEGAAKEAAKQPAKQAVNLQLVPANGSDQPVLANVTLVEPTAGVALLDFGFLDPGAMAALNRMARAGKQVPERLNGRLAARVAISYEALATLHQQIGGVLQALTRRQKPDAR